MIRRTFFKPAILNRHGRRGKLCFHGWEQTENLQVAWHLHLLLELPNPLVSPLNSRKNASIFYFRSPIKGIGLDDLLSLAEQDIWAIYGGREEAFDCKIKKWRRERGHATRDIDTYSDDFNDDWKIVWPLLLQQPLDTLKGRLILEKLR